MNPVSHEIYHALLLERKVFLVQTGNYTRAWGHIHDTAQLQFARVESMTYSCAFSPKPGIPGSEWQYT